MWYALQTSTSKILSDTIPVMSRSIGCNNQGPVVQSVVVLMSSLVVKMLTVPVSTISNAQVFLLIKCE